MTDFSPNLNLPYLLPNQAQKHMTVNAALQMLDIAVQLVLSALNLSTPPSAPEDGASFALSATPTGDWQGQSQAIATYVDSSWFFTMPTPGWRAWNLSDQSLYVFADNDWTAFSSSGFDGVNEIFTIDLSAGRVGIALDSPRYTLDVNGHIGCSASSPRIIMSEADQIEDEKNWRMNVTGGNFFLQSLNVANSVASTGLVLTRSGVQIDSVRLMTEDSLAVFVNNQQNVAIGHAAPTTRLDVDGPVRVGRIPSADLPSAASVDAGAIVFVTNASGGAQLAYSDGARWRRVADLSAI